MDHTGRPWTPEHHITFQVSKGPAKHRHNGHQHGFKAMVFTQPHLHAARAHLYSNIKSMLLKRITVV